MGGDDEIKETEFEKELGKVYSEKWDYYQNNIVPFENQIIEDAKSSNDASVYQSIADDVNLSNKRNFAQASEKTATNLAASGVNPNSGKFKNAVNSLSDMEAVATADSASRAQVSGQERYLDKMGNVMAMGDGQSTKAVSSLSDIAINSQRKAVHDASIAAQNRDSTLEAVGALGGAAASYYKPEKKKEGGN
ncbi:hypothetical protein JQC92_02285 [Shewanella sp. 202IG2-18]|uniref:hypothetical protein n=1 Tax=Parashewanella hymeniacidonis TaxID=2807618 RepID=UPI0019606A72|nr:hypothetical protein [Parashewanella hymeniacidonis]MBM7070869.1 hypothetical protein [Parashewanella hymeniacidonis]